MPKRWRPPLVLLPFLAWALLGPLLARRGIDRLGAEARDALEQLGAQVTETVQGLSDLLAFGRWAAAVPCSRRRSSGIG